MDHAVGCFRSTPESTSSASVARTLLRFVDPKIAEPWFGFGRALPSAVRAEVGAFKTVLNIRIVPDSPGQQPKKVADDSQNVWRRLPAKPASIISLAPDGGQQGLFEGR